MIFWILLTISRSWAAWLKVLHQGLSYFIAIACFDVLDQALISSQSLKTTDHFIHEFDLLGCFFDHLRAMAHNLVIVASKNPFEFLGVPLAILVARLLFGNRF